MKEPNRGPSSQSWVWLKASGLADRKVVRLEYTSRAQDEEPPRLLKSYHGYFMTVDYAGHSVLELPPDERLTCMPHVQRKKVWLFSYTVNGVSASAKIYSLAETAKVSSQEPYTWQRHVLDRPPNASSAADYETPLPWNRSPRDGTVNSLPTVGQVGVMDHILTRSYQISFE